MSVALLDVNVIIALFDPAHLQHDAAHEWFGRQRRKGWATCPITINGCIRVLSNPAYPTVEASPAAVAMRLRSWMATPDHHFWGDSVALTDDTLFRAAMIRGHRQVTDAYLLGLAVRNHGVLATFDGSIPVKAVIGVQTENLVVIRG